MTKPKINLRSLRAGLQHALGAVAELTPMAEGEESRAFGFQVGLDEFVVRVNRSSAGFRKDALAHRSFTSADLPIPEVVSIGTLDDGHIYCISRRAAGVTLQDLSPLHLPAVLRPVAEVMKAIASADVSKTSGFGPFEAEGSGPHATWREFLINVTDRERYDWPAIGTHLNTDRLNRLLDLVADLSQDCPEVRHLVHGDFGSNNVLTDQDRITGVIDWSEALFGDPLYDVANILFWRPWLTCMEQQAGYFEVQRQDLLSQTKRLRCYQLRIGLEEIYQSAITGNGPLVGWAMSRCDQIADGQV